MLEGQGALKLDSIEQNIFFTTEYDKDTQQISVKIYSSKPTPTSTPTYSLTTTLDSGSVIIN